jgi:transcriptional regulator with XRE-family HTH domain
MFIYDKYAVGDALRELRNERHLTQSQLAEKLELSAIHYSLIEQGQRKFSIEVLFKLMAVFEVDADRVLAINPKEEKIDIFSKKLSGLSREEQEYVTNAWILLVDGLLSNKERMAG